MKRRRRNPSDPAVTYWLVLLTLVVGGVAIASYKAMRPSDQRTALP